MRTRPARWLVLGLVASLLTACGPAAQASPSGTPSGSVAAPPTAASAEPSLVTASPGPIPSVQPPLAGLLAPGHVREVLLAAGVRLVDDGGATVAGPADDVPMVVVDSAIERLSDQAAARTGSLGATLDDLGGGAPMALPLSVVLAAYALGVETPGADIARAALAGQDVTHPKDVIFPTLVYILFAADAVHELGVRPATARTDFDAGITLAAFTPCSTFRDIVFGSINKVFDWLKVPEINLPKTGIGFLDSFLSGLARVVVGGINIVIEAGRTIVVNAARFLLADIIDLIAKAATIAAVVGNVLTQVQPLTLRASAVPPLVTKGTSPVTTVVTVTGSTAGLAEWPPGINDCAKTATGHDLPSLKPIDSPVIWTPIVSAPIEGLLERTTPTDDTLRDLPGTAGTEAKLTLVTVPETPELLKNELKRGIVRVNVRVHRTGLDQVQAALIELAQSAVSTLTNHLPEPFKSYIDGLIAPAIQSATSGFTTLMDARTFTFVDVAYHGDRKPSPSPPARASAPAGSPGVDLCSLLTDAEVSAVIGVPIARREASGTRELGGCVKGTARVPLGPTEGIYYASFTVSRVATSFYSDATGQAGVQAVSGVGDQAAFLPSVGAIFVVTGGVEFFIQVAKAGVPGSLDDVFGLARLLASRI